MARAAEALPARLVTLVLVSDSAGFLHALLRLERPDPWQRAAIVREWQRLRSTALPFNHCDGFDRDR